MRTKHDGWVEAEAGLWMWARIVDDGQIDWYDDGTRGALFLGTDLWDAGPGSRVRTQLERSRAQRNIVHAAWVEANEIASLGEVTLGRWMRHPDTDEWVVLAPNLDRLRVVRVKRSDQPGPRLIPIARVERTLNNEMFYGWPA